MAGSGELFKGSEGKWSFRVKASNGTVVAIDDGPGYKAKSEARSILQKLLKGDYNGPIREPAALGCGQEITKSITLDGDLRCNGGPALIVTADNVVLDLAGFTVSGEGSAAGHPGILLRNVKGVTVRKGTVKGFGAGVAIAGGANNVIENVTVEDNIGSTEGDFGDGITINASSGNAIRGNTVRRNGPFAGISLVGACTKNEIRDNLISDNNMLPGEPSRGRQDMGIRLEGPGANNNKVVGNTVTGSGAEGICILPTCTDPQAGCAGTPGNESNEISENLSHKNGTSGQGSGIRLFAVPQPVAASKTSITGNVTNDNVTFGIAIDAAGTANPGPPKNKVTGNSGKGNGQFDGYDGNTPGCGSNVWKDNDFTRVNQPCVGAPNPSGLTEGIQAARSEKPVEV
jgi:parallel beta-helix repeat protein